MSRYAVHRWFLGAIIIGFLLLIFPATGQIYHQDEYSWLTQMDGTDHSPDVHPPLYLWLGEFVGNTIGFGHIRLVTVPFALANVALVYAISYTLTRRRSIALVAALLLTLNAYNVIAATMVDIDGALLPFFVLLTVLAYLRVREGRYGWYWALALGIVGGFFAKLSFILCAGTLAVDWTVHALQQRSMTLRKFTRHILPWTVGVVALAAVLYLLLSWYASGIVAYAAHFSIFDFGSRAYADLAFKLLKSMVLVGPLLLFGGLMGLLDRTMFHRYRFWWLYLLFSTLFYAVVFDFTTLTIERYFMFAIAPLAIIAAEPLWDMLQKIRRMPWRPLLVAGLVATAIAAVLFIPHDVIPLYPKAVFAHRALSLQWNFLVPITGGSGPVGFYVSALFVGLSWLIMAGALLVWQKVPKQRAFATALFLCLGVAYTGVMLEEYLVGSIYGSPNRVAWETVRYVNTNPDITQVISYYNYGPYDLRQSGKYAARFYVTPKRDYSGRIMAWRGYYMIIDFPAIAADDQYMRIITRCPIAKQFTDKLITGTVYDCTALP